MHLARSDIDLGDGPMTLAEIEAETLANNSEIRSLEQQVRVAATTADIALAVEDRFYLEPAALVGLSDEELIAQVEG